MNPAQLHAYLKRRDSEPAHSLLGPRRTRLLDIGSGMGEDLRHLIAMGWDTVGLEPFQRVSGLPIVRGAAESLPFRDESFGAVTCILVLPIVPRPEMVLKEAHRVLRREGVAVFTVFSRSPLNWRVAATYYAHRKSDAAPRSRLFSVHGFRRLLDRTGFGSVSWIRTDYLPWFTGLLTAETSWRLYSWLDRMDTLLSRSPLAPFARKLVFRAVKT
jgi:SAM-dependent methyltransferase